MRHARTSQCIHEDTDLEDFGAQQKDVFNVEIMDQVSWEGSRTESCQKPSPEHSQHQGSTERAWPATYVPKEEPTQDAGFRARLPIHLGGRHKPGDFLQIEVPRHNAIASVREAVRSAMQARGWPELEILLTNKEGELILTETELMNLHEADMNYVTREANQKWCRIQHEPKAGKSKHLIDADATIQDTAMDISYSQGHPITITDEIGGVVHPNDWHALVNRIRDGDMLRTIPTAHVKTFTVWTPAQAEANGEEGPRFSTTIKAATVTEARSKIRKAWPYEMPIYSAGRNAWMQGQEQWIKWWGNCGRCDTLLTHPKPLTTFMFTLHEEPFFTYSVDTDKGFREAAVAMMKHKKDIMEHRWIDRHTESCIDPSTWRRLAQKWGPTVEVRLEAKLRGGAERRDKHTTKLVFMDKKDIVHVCTVGSGESYRACAKKLMAEQATLLEYRWVIRNNKEYLDMTTWKSTVAQAEGEVKIDLEPKLRGGGDDFTTKMRQMAERALTYKGVDQARTKTLLNSALQKLGSAAFGTAFTNLDANATDREIWDAMKKLANNPDNTPRFTWISRKEAHQDAKTNHEGFTVKGRGKTGQRGRGGGGKNDQKGKDADTKHAHTWPTAGNRTYGQTIPKGTTLSIRPLSWQDPCGRIIQVVEAPTRASEGIALILDLDHASALIQTCKADQPMGVLSIMTLEQVPGHTGDDEAYSFLATNAAGETMEARYSIVLYHLGTEPATRAERVYTIQTEDCSRMRLTFFRQEVADHKALAGASASDWTVPRDSAPNYKPPPTLWGQLMEKPVRTGYFFF